MERKQELAELLKRINDSKKSDVHFNELYKELKTEIFRAENNNNSHYLSWLKEIDTSAQYYISKKTNKYKNYSNFLDEFRICVSDQLSRQSI
ncbi:MAG: hypothetical protein HGB12_07360 [Bacteroidetes bacterium]|nr:hypothetical protein [Bacteroidota bacterium]